MLRPPRTSAFRLACAMTLVALPALAGEPAGVHWPCFRGPRASGIADGFPTAVTWDVETSEHVRWKTPIPGLAHSSPVVWGDRVFVTTAVSDDPEPYLRVGLYGASPDHPEDFEHDFKLLCLDKTSGRVLWERTAVRTKPKVKRHVKATHANCTPATDGKRVVAFFGSEGLYCYDVNGKLLWTRDLGLLDAGPYDAPGLQWGFASSPVIHENRVIIHCNARNQTFVAALDLATGHDVWRTEHKDVPAWSTPTVLPATEKALVIVNGYKRIAAYDLADGAERWHLAGGGDVPTPTPVVADDLVYITSAHGGAAPILAIRTSAKGDITLASGQRRNDHIAWSYARRGNYMQTPLAYRGLLYCCRDNGAMSCLDARTGKIQYRRRLGRGRTGFTASPVAADGKIYFTSEEGDVHVLKAGAEFKLLATNPLGEICMASPAISEGTLFFRTRHHLVAVAP